MFYSFVIGMVLASAFEAYLGLKTNRRSLLLLTSSFLFLFLISLYGKNLVFMDQDPSLFIFFPAGFVISLALIIPGISGSYVLLLLGLYEEVLFALKELEVLKVLSLGLGALLGLFLTAKVIKKLLKDYRNEVLSLIIGLMLGSLPLIFPFSFDDFSTPTSNTPLDLAFFLLFLSLGYLFIFFITDLGKLYGKK